MNEQIYKIVSADIEEQGYTTFVYFTLENEDGGQHDCVLEIGKALDFNIGDRVRYVNDELCKIEGDEEYTATEIILGGLNRVVVEDKDGILHLFHVKDNNIDGFSIGDKVKVEDNRAILVEKEIEKYTVVAKRERMTDYQYLLRNSDGEEHFYYSSFLFGSLLDVGDVVYWDDGVMKHIDEHASPKKEEPLREAKVVDIRSTVEKKMSEKISPQNSSFKYLLNDVVVFEQEKMTEREMKIHFNRFYDHIATSAKLRLKVSLKVVDNFGNVLIDCDRLRIDDEHGLYFEKREYVFPFNIESND